ncbi:MAG: p21-activated protein kinase-interacting protein 1-like protein [Bathelium mastoideum]|nr:MAG: p21-activated protein kinase-interacting protein 1-like protein [Bathelium mastoideum]
MATKRKRDDETANGTSKKHVTGTLLKNDQTPSITIQIITGSYERALHGFTATIPQEIVNSKNQEPFETSSDPSELTESSPFTVSFADTFLFNAHHSSLTTLALSPSSTTNPTKITLATGSTDAQIHLFSLSTSPPPISKSHPVPPPSTTTTPIPPIHENPLHRTLGTLLHHTSPITALTFPSPAKLLSASLDNTLALTRTRDWTLLAQLHAPAPNPGAQQRRPEGDTAAPGDAPRGINAVAVHPSRKLAVSVGRGERCLRLWNLVTGRKAGVLGFERQAAVARVGGGVGGKYGRRQEGQGVVWEEEDGGEEFAVAFEGGAVVFELDARPRCVIVPEPRTKVGKIRYLPGSRGKGENGVKGGEGKNNEGKRILALSTEDGRALFYDTAGTNLGKDDVLQAESNGEKVAEEKSAIFLGQLGGRSAEITSRIKDFKILELSDTNASDVSGDLLVITASSDGSVRVWRLSRHELESPGPALQNGESIGGEKSENGTIATSADETTKPQRQVGKLLATQETGHRITCLEAFIMSSAVPVPDEANGDAKASEDGDSKSSSEDDEEDEE